MENRQKYCTKMYKSMYRMSIIQSFEATLFSPMKTMKRNKNGSVSHDTVVLM